MGVLVCLHQVEEQFEKQKGERMSLKQSIHRRTDLYFWCICILINKNMAMRERRNELKAGSR